MLLLWRPKVHTPHLQVRKVFVELLRRPGSIAHRPHHLVAFPHCNDGHSVNQKRSGSDPEMCEGLKVLLVGARDSVFFAALDANNRVLVEQVDDVRFKAQNLVLVVLVHLD